MLKIGSCTVLYNPDNIVISNVSTYSEWVDVCVVVDNSDNKNEISKYFENNSSYIYIDMHGNQGIAAALNAGIEYLHSFTLSNVPIGMCASAIKSSLT